MNRTINNLHEFRLLDGKLQVRYSYWVDGHTQMAGYNAWGEWKDVPNEITTFEEKVK